MTATPAGLPIWGALAQLPAPPALPRRADVVIVGGGITGVALLGILRRREVDAVLVERDTIASGASGRNAGFLLAGVSENYARAVSHHGRDVASAVWRFTTENHTLTATAATAFDSGYRRRGSLTVALDEEEAAGLDESAELLAEDGLPGELVDPAAVPGGVRALFNPGDGEVDPVRLVRGLAAPVAGRVHEHQRVVAVEDGQNAATVRVGGHSIEAAAVVLATNAWTSQLLPSAPIRPVRAQMLATGRAGPRLGVPVYAQWGHRYWRQREDGCVLVGGFRDRALAAEVGLEATPTEQVQRHLDGQLRELGIDAAVTHRWAGIMGFSDDGLPLVGLAAGCRRIHLCGGYTGHGMGFAVNAATALAARLLDATPLPAWLDAARAGALSRPVS